jgi:hypothetical protein
MTEPDLALSLRQPWAWAIFNGKDIENRSWRSTNPGLGVRGRVVIHASTGLTRAEYVEAYEFMRAIGARCPPAGALIRGAAIGTVEIVDVVEESASPWFVGRYGFVLRAPQLWRSPRPGAGALGFFNWRKNLGGELTPPAKWMRPKPDTPHPVEVKATADLFARLARGVQAGYIPDPAAPQTALVAQRIEQGFSKPEVAGSSPAEGASVPEILAGKRLTPIEPERIITIATPIMDRVCTCDFALDSCALHGRAGDKEPGE